VAARKLQHRIANEGTLELSGKRSHLLEKLRTCSRVSTPVGDDHERRAVRPHRLVLRGLSTTEREPDASFAIKVCLEQEHLGRLIPGHLVNNIASHGGPGVYGADELWLGIND
jgi:hypothetical protein